MTVRVGVVRSAAAAPPAARQLDADSNNAKPCCNEHEIIGLLLRVARARVEPRESEEEMAKSIPGIYHYTQAFTWVLKCLPLLTPLGNADPGYISPSSQLLVEDLDELRRNRGEAAEATCGPAERHRWKPANGKDP